MVKLMCVLVLLAASCYALPLEEGSEQPKLPRPSPINPEVVSDPKPTAAKEASTTESHVQRIPASGVKLSVEVAKNEQTTTVEPAKEKPKRSLESESTSTRTSTSTSTSTSTTTTSKPAFRRNQPTTSTEQPSSTAASSTTHSPVSVKTPVGTARTKREVEVTAATASPTTGLPKRTTTLLPSLSASEDKEGPHYVRPVPVEQILKNLGQTEKHSTEHSTTEKASESTEQEDSTEEKSAEATRAQESTHQKNHPVIHQQGA